MGDAGLGIKSLYTVVYKIERDTTSSNLSTARGSARSSSRQSSSTFPRQKRRENDTPQSVDPFTVVKSPRDDAASCALPFTPHQPPKLVGIAAETIKDV